MLNGICCSGSTNISWVNSTILVNSETYSGTIAKYKKYYEDIFMNIPIIRNDDITTNQLNILTNNNQITNNVSVLTNFFGINEDINIYDIHTIYTQSKSKDINLCWKTLINDDETINIVTGSSWDILSGFQYNMLEQVKTVKYLFTRNPYNIHNTINNKNCVVSIGSTPRYSWIYKDITTTNNTYLSMINVKKINGTYELLSSTYTRINYYCDVLSSLLNEHWYGSKSPAVNSVNYPYSYFDLSGITDIDTLAKAIIQYEYGNPYVIDDCTVSKDNICTKSLGTLNMYNFIKWKDINSITQQNLFNFTGVDYTTYDSNIFNKNWIKNGYDISDLNI